MTAGWPLAKACRQGPAAKDSWLSSRAWATGSEALAQRSRPSASASMIPVASTSNSCLAATTVCSSVLAKSSSGFRSVRVAMLLASIEGSIGRSVPWVRSPNWRTRSTGQARRWPWGADQAQQPHAVVVWAPADPRRRQQQKPATVSLRPPGEHRKHRLAFQGDELAFVIRGSPTAVTTSSRSAGSTRSRALLADLLGSPGQKDQIL
jgi:hypothetical protein